MADVDSYELVARYQGGESEAATKLFDRYVERLLALAKSRLSSKMRRRVDPEDVVQSAFRSFFLHARDDAYVLKQSGDLWRLLVQITLHKLYGQAERHHAKRRNVQREEVASAAIDAVNCPEPTPVEVVALAEQMHLVIGQLTSDEQLVLTLCLQGEDVAEIAISIGKSPRTVRRILATVRERIARQLTADGDAESVDRVAMKNRQIDRRVTLQAGDYMLEQLIGAGGMGKVYRASDRTSGRFVAVKALRKMHLANRSAVEQFVQEAEILATLRHPNIVGVHGLGRFPGGGLFIVMDFVEGRNLQELLRNGPFGVQRAIAIVREVAAAIAHAHEKGVVHADLKPANVLLDGAERAVVTDFGFAQLVVADAASRSSRIGGSFGYMAPEVAQLRQPPTAAADIFGLGALLWALATGSPPDAMASSFADDDAIAPIEPFLRRCLVEQPRLRYQSVSDFLVALPD